MRLIMIPLMGGGLRYAFALYYGVMNSYYISIINLYSLFLFFISLFEYLYPGCSLMNNILYCPDWLEQRPRISRWGFGTVRILHKSV